ncbi:reverse transcriptase domain-containing protein [Artemisia annua]|uniref:Reverse transcriptase domain-containing protein n=1 Tax=Artemisia annua TaxID=35608 RepID=A0A2U1QGQ0_ARTAN|nr:reverse transcriptase domain-containing protein [Artemisia annua]
MEETPTKSFSSCLHVVSLSYQAIHGLFCNPGAPQKIGSRLRGTRVGAKEIERIGLERSLLFVNNSFGVRKFLDSFHDDGSLAMLTVDFSNAFNAIDRSALLREVHCHCPSIFPWVQFLYAQPARLYVGNERLGAYAGVQQGDPLGPLLFALALHPLVLKIQDDCALPFHAWYLDDGTIIGDSVQVAKALDIISREGPSLGLQLNIKKN